MIIPAICIFTSCAFESEKSRNTNVQHLSIILSLISNDLHAYKAVQINLFI